MRRSKDKADSSQSCKVCLIDFPACISGSSSAICLPVHVADLLGIDKLNLKHGDRIAATLGLVERTPTSSPLLPFMGLVEDARVLAKWIINVKMGNATAESTWPISTNGPQLGRHHFLAMIRKYAGQASLDELWSALPAPAQSWPKTIVEQLDIPDERVKAAHAMSMASFTRYRNGSVDHVSLWCPDGQPMNQRVPLPSPAVPHLVSLFIGPNGVPQYALRAPGDCTTPVTWYDLPHLCPAMMVSVNDAMALRACPAFTPSTVPSARRERPLA